LLISFITVAVLTTGFYLGSRSLARWVVVGRPAARFRRSLDHCLNIADAASNKT